MERAIKINHHFTNFLLLTALLIISEDVYSKSKIPEKIYHHSTERTSLTAKEIEGVFRMREEEKFAHDVYTMFFKKWNLSIFSNIAASESNHMDAMLGLIREFSLLDPAEGKAIGVFQDSSLSRLYSEFVEIGSKSLLDACIVGAMIEDMDIEDLNSFNLSVRNENIKFVYQNLSRGSRNHLRAFHSQIIRLGGHYSPRYISKKAFDAIIHSPKERGRR